MATEAGMIVKCDFCSSTKVKHRLLCRTAEVALTPEVAKTLNVHLTSLGDWAACDICFTLIKRDDRKALLRRSWRTFRDVMPSIRNEHKAMQAVFRQGLSDVQATFWMTWTGLDEPWPP